jgi:menaquinone-dependent protoporphyrinogen oxidase
MRVLVTAASKHGATVEIAEAIADSMSAAGAAAAVVPPEEVDSLEGYDAVVIGSAVYAGRWLEPAKDLVSRLGDELGRRPVWLFSSGPLGDPPKPEEDPVDVGDLRAATGAREHAVFAGKLDRATLGFGEKAIVLALRAPEGDFRDWDRIRGWARDVVRALDAEAGAGAG